MHREQTNLNIIWIGAQPPDLITSNLHKWRETYGARVSFWDENRLDQFKKYFSGVDFHPAKIADICRVLILREYGGWYIDADMEPGNLSFEESSRVELFMESSRVIMNSLMYFPKGSLFAEYLKVEIMESLLEEHLTIANQTGPMALVRALHTYSVMGGEQSKYSIHLNQQKYVKSKKLSRLHIGTEKNGYFVIDHALSSWKPLYSYSKYSRLKTRTYFFFSELSMLIYLHELMKFVLLRKKWHYFILCRCNRKVFSLSLIHI